MKVRVMSFNTQHCENFKTGKIDFKLMADTIKQLGGEIIGLQEIRGEGEDKDYTDQLKRLTELTGYYGYFAKALDIEGKGPYGNALLSKYPIISVQTIPIPDPVPAPENCETRCILKAVINVGAPLTVIDTHFGLSAEEQQCAVDTVMAQIEPERCVLMGDFNINPDNSKLSGICDKMFDTAALFDEPKLSWPSDAPRRKIDYIFTSRDLKVLSADIPAVISSDHRPYICDLEL